MTLNWDVILASLLMAAGDDIDDDGGMLCVTIRQESPGCLDRDDMAVLAVLTALSRAVAGEISLPDLAIACIEFDQASRPAPHFERPAPPPTL
jgi:hypothetical protein